MRRTFRQTAIIATSVLALGAVAAVAAPPSTSSTPSPAAMPSAPAAAPAQPGSAPMMGSGRMATGQTATGQTATGQTATGQPNGGRMEANIDQKISDLQTKLQISAAQKPQWERFTQIMRDNARDMDREFQSRAQSLDTMNAEANMKSYAEIANHHADDVRKLIPAFDALYAKMTESQKKTADQVFRDEAHQHDQARNG